jgi:hypothetical protein
MEELFSINKTAYVLGRDQATITRALRFVPPDGYQGSQPRWTMASITAALALTPQARRNASKSCDRYRIPSKALGELRFNFEKQIGLISTEESLDRRREMALALAPLLHEYQTTYLDIGRSLRIADDDLLGARADLIWSEMMNAVSEAAAWPLHSDDFFLKMIEAMPSHPDDYEAA